MVVACTALYPYQKESMAELACLAVHPDYQNNRRGELLLQHMESRGAFTRGCRAVCADNPGNTLVSRAWF